MRTLAQPIASWLKQGQKPRTFIRITDSAGAEILFSGTQALGTAINDIDSLGSISRSIRPEGGMSEASGTLIKNLILNNPLPLCEEATINTQWESLYKGGGRLLSEGSSGTPYADVRNSTTANDYQEVALVVGRSYNAGSGIYSDYRSILQYSIPAISVACDDAYIELTGLGKFTTAAFKIGIAKGTWTNYEPGQYNDFENWAASGTYALELLNEEWSTSEDADTGAITGTVCRIRFNQAGRDEILACAGDTLKIILISENDYDSTKPDPTGQEYVQFTNQPPLKLRYDSFTLENQIVSEYLGVDPLPAAYSGMDKIYTGVVDSYEISDRNLGIESRQNNFKKDKIIPSKIITLDNWPNCPEANIGKPYPILYGTFAMTGLHKQGVGCFGATGPVTDKDYSYPDPFVGLVVSLDKTTAPPSRTVLFAGHDIGITLFTAGAPIFAWNSTLKAFEMFPCDGTEAWDAALGCYKSIMTPKAGLYSYAYFPDILCKNTYQGVAMVLPIRWVGSWSAANEIFDIDPTNYATMPVGGSLEVHFDDKNTHYLAIFVANVEFLGGADPTKLEFEVYQRQETTPDTADSWQKLGISSTPFTGDGEVKFYYSDMSTALDYLRIPLDMTQYYFNFNNTNSVGTIRLKIFAGFVYHDTAENTEVYKAGSFCYGRRYGSWIDEAGRSNTYDADDMIENPAGVIESIARDEMGLVAAEIDAVAFDTVTATCDTLGLKYAFQILEQKSAKEIIGDLAFQAGLFCFWDSQDRLKIKRFDSTAAFPNSTTNIPGLLDTFTTTGAPLAGSFTTHQILSGPTISKMKISEVYNDFIINYDYNYGLKGYSKTLRVNKDGSNLDNDICVDLGTTAAAMITLCDDSYDKIHTVNTFAYDAWAIKDETTATALIKHLVERLSVVRFIIDFQAGNSAVLFEEADFINVRDDLIENRFGTAVMNIKKWMIIGIDSNAENHNVTLKCIEV